MKHASLLLALVMALPAFGASPSIYDIQYTTDPSGDSPFVGLNLSTDGIVYGVYPDGFAMADAAGAWNGLYVYNPDLAQPAVGDAVTVTGDVQEYYGLTELSLNTSGLGTYTLTIDSSGNTPYAATVVATGDIATGAATAESYEGVLVEVQNVTVTDPNLGYGEWAIDDDPPTTAATRVDDLADYWYAPALNDTLDFVRGMLFFDWGDFKIEPRGDDDISATNGPPTQYDIWEIQGSGFVSPVVGENVTTSGVVTGFFEGNLTTGYETFEGVFIQDPTGDANDATSDGIFVHSDDVAAAVALGDLVEVTGMVREFGEYDEWSCTEDCATTIRASEHSITGTGSVSAVVLDPPTDTDGDNDYLEAREGMVVSVDGNAAVVGPTSYGAIAVVDADEGIDRVLRNSDQHGKVVGARHWEAYGDIGGSDPDNLIVGSTAAAVSGPMTTTYGAYTVITQDGAPWTTVTSAPVPAEEPSWPAAVDGSFTVLSLNAHNLEAGASTHLDKLVPIVVEAGCPTFLALQEIDTVSTVTEGVEDEVLSELVTRLGTEGCAYASAYSHPDIGDHGVAALWRTDAVSGASSTSEYQGCSEWGSSSSTAYDSSCDGVVDEYPLFSRRPLVVTATVDGTCAGSSPVEVKLIVAHLKSMNGGAPAAQRRLEQAEFISDLVEDFLAAGDEHVMLAGDLNDFEDSPALDALTGEHLVSIWDGMAEDDPDRYSYIYRGISQVLDYILYTGAFQGGPSAAGPLHYNADFPHDPYTDDGTVSWAASDHDPVAATFGACSNALIFADGFESGDTGAW